PDEIDKWFLSLAGVRRLQPGGYGGRKYVMGDDAHGRSVVSLNLHFAVGPFDDGHGGDAVEVGLFPFEARVGEMREAGLGRWNWNFAGNRVFAGAFVAPIDAIAMFGGVGGRVAGENP